MDNKVHPAIGWTFFWAATDDRMAGRDRILPALISKGGEGLQGDAGVSFPGERMPWRK
jgi:hypothetical protein